MVRGYSFSPRVAYVGLPLLGLAGLAVLYAVDPRNSLLYGDFASALGYNPLAVLSLPIIVYSFSAGVLRAFHLPAPRPVFLHPRWTWALLAGVVAFWALRNLPFGLLTALAP